MEVTLNLSRDLGFLTDEDYQILYEDLQKFIAKLVLFSKHLEKRVPRTKDVMTNRVLRSGPSYLEGPAPGQ